MTAQSETAVSVEADPSFAHSRSGEDFAFETTLASRSLVPFLRKCQGKGYEVSLMFLWLRSATLAERRVAARVQSGGHKVPRQVIRRRVRAGIHHFWTLYAPLADHWVVYDNSGPEPELVARNLFKRIDPGVRQGVARALEEHRKAGGSVFIWQDGRIASGSKAEASGNPSGNDEREERMVSGEQRIANGRK